MASKLLNPYAYPYHPLCHFDSQYLPSHKIFQGHQSYLSPQTSCYHYEQGHFPLSMHAHIENGTVSPTKQTRHTNLNTRGRRRQMTSKIWVPKNLRYEELGCQVDISGKTTLMMRNIPNKLKRKDLLYILDKHCMHENKKGGSCAGWVKSAYDFAYLPMDFQQDANKGYAFVNFTSIDGAIRACKCFHKMNWATLSWGPKGIQHSSKTCEISIAKIQGIRKLIQQFQNKLFYCHTDEYLPVILSPASDGSFPAPSPVVIGWCVKSPSN